MLGAYFIDLTTRFKLDAPAVSTYTNYQVKLGNERRRRAWASAADLAPISKYPRLQDHTCRLHHGAVTFTFLYSVSLTVTDEIGVRVTRCCVTEYQHEAETFFVSSCVLG